MVGDLGSISLASKLSKMIRLRTLYLCLRNNKFMTATSIDMISESLTKMKKLKELFIDFRSMELNCKSANKFFTKLNLLTEIEILTINLK